jgi:hypothetical protein
MNYPLSLPPHGLASTMSWGIQELHIYSSNVLLNIRFVIAPRSLSHPPKGLYFAPYGQLPLLEYSSSDNAMLLVGSFQAIAVYFRFATTRAWHLIELRGSELQDKRIERLVRDTREYV